MAITGTSYFTSLESARLYYAPYGYSHADVDHKLAQGEIHIGRPPITYGKERWTKLDGGLRWGIEDSK